MFTSQGRDRVAVFLNTEQSRTDAFAIELRRRDWLIKEFHCGQWKEAFTGATKFVRAIWRCQFVLVGSGFPWQIPWLLLAYLLGRTVVMDYPVDVTLKPFPEVWHWKQMIGFFSRRADIFLTLSSREYVIDKFHLNPARVLFVENCPDVQRIEESRSVAPRVNLPEEAIVIGYSGVAWSHQIDAFVPILKAIQTRLPNVLWLVISDPANPMIIRLQQKAAELGISNSIRFLPVIKPYEEFIATINQCHLWISHMDNRSLLGRHELRIELLEMGILGKPVAAAPTPALTQHGFIDGENIIFVDPADPEQSAAHIVEYLKNQSALSRISSNLSRHVRERFSLPNSVDRLLQRV
jgi:glycosyltransferase involved in cell wall biosynthesis